MSSSNDDYHDESWPQIAPRTDRTSPPADTADDDDRDDDGDEDANVLPLRAARD